MLELWVTGPFRAAWAGEDLEVPSRRGRALLAWLAVERRTAPREHLAELLWGPRRGANLRQELYRLRRLPGAATWLVEEGEAVAVRAELRAEPARGPFLEDLGQVGTEAFQDWLVSRRGGPARRDLEDALLRALAIEPELRPDEVAAVVEGSVWELAETWDRLARGGDLPEGRIRPALAAAMRAELAEPARRLLHVRVAQAVPRLAHVHLEAGGAVDEAARAWFRHGRASGDLAALGRAAELATDPEERARMLAALVSEGRRQGDDRVGSWASALGTLARRSQHPAAVVADAFATLCLALDRGDLPAARRAQVELSAAAWDADSEALAALGAVALALRDGDLAAAEAALDEVAPTARGPRVAVANARGALAAYRGDLDGADREHRRALQWARAEGDLGATVSLLNSLAATEERRGDVEGAWARVEEALELVGSAPSPLRLGLLHNRAVLAGARGRLGLLRASANLLLDDARRAGAAGALGQAMHHRALLEAEVGRLAEARVALAKAAEAWVADVPWSAVAAFDAALWGDGDVEGALARLRAVGRRELLREALLDVVVHHPDAAPVVAGLAALEGLGGGPGADARRAYARWRLGGPAPAPAGGRDGWRTAVAAGDRPALDRWVRDACEGLLPAQATSLVARVERGWAEPGGLRVRSS